MAADHRPEGAGITGEPSGPPIAADSRHIQQHNWRLWAWRHPLGRKVTRGRLANYDAVIGFDHPTLSEDPLANATDLLRRLKSAADGAPPPYLDVVVHSRGGLVVRSLLEHLLPLSDWRPRIGRVVFVAAPNGGTLLAEPENWKKLIDLYTNLATVACKLIGMIPQAKPTTLILQELIQGLGAFVQYCATQAVTEGQVPGLAAMEPGGAFITRINEIQQGQPTIAASYYSPSPPSLSLNSRAIRSRKSSPRV